MPKKVTSSEWERHFALLWDATGGETLRREYRFDKSRRWRADFAWLEARLLIEIEGGIWNRGRHLTPAGFIRDAEKYLAATLQGWTVIRLAPNMLTADTIRQIQEYGKGRTDTGR